MNHINLDREDKKIQEFVRSLSENAGGSVLELGGRPVLQVVPVGDESVEREKLKAAIGKRLGRKRPGRRRALDPEKLKAAILKRRDESRELNKEWDAVDREMWDKLP